MNVILSNSLFMLHIGSRNPGTYVFLECVQTLVVVIEASQLELSCSGLPIVFGTGCHQNYSSDAQPRTIPGPCGLGMRL